MVAIDGGNLEIAVAGAHQLMLRVFVMAFLIPKRVSSGVVTR